MKKIIIGLLALSSISAFAQTKTVEISYDCELDVELQFVGRKVLLPAVTRIESCDSIPFEVNGAAYVGKTFTFDQISHKRSKLAAINEISQICSAMTFQLDESGSYHKSCLGDKLVQGENAEIAFVTQEGLRLASNVTPVKLSKDAEGRILDVNRFCKKLATDHIKCEAVRTIINP